MEKEIIVPLEKNKIAHPTSGCCGGTPTNNADACCKLDEEKKAEGGIGCGCNTSKSKSTSTSCC